jgi:hypothetical protein
MASHTHISVTCTISKQTVCKNGETVFMSDEANIPASLVEVYKHFELNYTRFYKMDTLSKLGWLTSELLLKNNFNKEDYSPAEVGMVFVNANSSLDSDVKYMASVADIPSPALFVYTLPNIMIGEISIRNQFKGEAAFFISESFDTDFIERYVNNLFDNDVFKACICGWVDVLVNDYKAVLFLIEKGNGAIPFTAGNMNKYFND